MNNRSPARSPFSLPFLDRFRGGSQATPQRNGSTPLRCVSSPMTPPNEEQNARLLNVKNGDCGDGNLGLKNGVDYINVGREDQSEIYGYRRSIVRTALVWILIVASGGLLRLLFHWMPRHMLAATHVRCDVAHATDILVVEIYKKYKKYFVKKVRCLRAQDFRYDDEYSALRCGHTTAQTRPADGTEAADEDKGKSIESFSIPTLSGIIKEVKSIRWFQCKKSSYVWDDDEQAFYKLQGLDFGQTLSSLHSFSGGLSWRAQMRRRLVHGPNAISVPVTPLLRLLFLEALNPFYIFQVFSVCLWFADDYIYYASVIVATSVLSIMSEVYQMHRNQVTLRTTIQSSGAVEVLRENGEVQRIPSDHVAPGDVLVIPGQGCAMQCDAALLQGTAIVNESMLTGESVPVTKTPLANRADVFFNEKEHSRHVLFCGTQVIQTRFYGNERVTAVVLRTGFGTTKGELVKAIMYPPPVDFRFQQDTYKFVLVLVAIASVGFVYTVINKALNGDTAGEIAMDALDLITIVVPPALPMAMTVGILYALQRLKKFHIFCISPRSINISGVLNCICFDKTGTLTEDGLDMKGVVGVRKTADGLMMSDMWACKGGKCTGMPREHLLFAMAACHSITKIDMKMVGDPLDLKMFESTGWVLEEPGSGDDTSKYDLITPSLVRPADEEEQKSSYDNPSYEQDKTRLGQSSLEIGILRQFPFSSSLQRMSVITRRVSDAHFALYSKGSPEMIASLSKPETLPANLQEVLLGYTQKGFRVLALGWRELRLSYPKAHRIGREEVENELQFLGLLVLENRLKEETTAVITQLKNANIRTVMVTGDNLLTAVSVGRECGLVGRGEEVVAVRALKGAQGEEYSIQFEATQLPSPAEAIRNGVNKMKSSLNGSTKGKMKNEDVHIDVDSHPSTSITLPSASRWCFSVEGKAWTVIREHYPDLLKRLVVKGAVFARMNPDQKRQLVTELQALGYYVGMCGDGANDCGALKSAHVGVSLSEAEASVASPFTARDPNISCVPILIREGRAALVTSFGVFKYMAAYSLTQFVSVMILYSIHSNLTDLQFLYIDLFLITVFAFFFGRTAAFEGPLASTPPSSSLLSLAPIASILVHLAIIIGTQTFSFFYVQQQPWFVPFNQTTSEDIPAGYENYAVFSISQFQYIILAVVFAKGPPYRQPMYSNYLFTGAVVLLTVCSALLTLVPPQGVINALQLVMPPWDDSSATFFRWQILMASLINCFLAVVAEYILIDYCIHRKLRSKLRKNKSKKKYLAIESAMIADKNFPILFNRDLTNKCDMKEAKSPDDPSAKKQPPSNVISLTQYHSSL